MNQNPEPGATSTDPKQDFIRAIVARDRAAGVSVVTRFPPEPNGYLHVGHAKAICLNFALAAESGGVCNLRFDDTNPSAEEAEFVEAIQADIRWLGYDWGERLFFTSSYFEQLYTFARELIVKGLAYVDDLTAEQTREYRGTVTEPGRDSPHRSRTVEENLDLFERMRAGEFADGSRTLRARIDMASPNLNLRDPVLYRISSVPHHRTGTEWAIYPMYDWAHGQSDALEGVTHSICTLEFENHRPLYDWFLDNIDAPCHPRQIEFARFNLSHTITSKRKLRALIEGHHVSGWSDPRMPTLRAMRRRGVPPEAIRTVCEEGGVTKVNGVTEMAVFDNAVRSHLNATVNRVMAVLDPVELVIENYPEDSEEWLEAVNNPEDAAAGVRQVPFSRTLYIERDDFLAEAPRKYFRLTPGREVRLRYAYYVTCTGFENDPETGALKRVLCTYDPETRGGDSADGRKVKGTIHWVSASHSLPAEARLFDHLFSVTNPSDVPAGGDFTDNLNPDSLVVADACRVEPSVASAPAGARFQFERKGYFCVDEVDSAPGALVFNRTVALRDAWAKQAQPGR